MSSSCMSFRSLVLPLLALTVIAAGCDKPPVPGAKVADSAAAAAAALAEMRAVPIAPEGKWRGVGRTELGTAVYVDTTSVRDSASMRFATFRIKHPKPFPIDSGRKSFVMTDADLIVVCGAPTKSVARWVRHYADLEGSQQVAERVDEKAPWNVESP
ncbi:MAG: hypothetical protein MUF00_11200, partial [Gemmatimonadaceae bacterium]|nr:hypothetical protein [Gemmatimonadaceae bacterium]